MVLRGRNRRHPGAHVVMHRNGASPRSRRAPRQSCRGRCSSKGRPRQRDHHRRRREPSWRRNAGLLAAVSRTLTLRALATSSARIPAKWIGNALVEQRPHHRPRPRRTESAPFSTLPLPERVELALFRVGERNTNHRVVRHDERRHVGRKGAQQSLANAPRTCAIVSPPSNATFADRCARRDSEPDRSLRSHRGAGLPRCRARSRSAGRRSRRWRLRRSAVGRAVAVQRSRGRAHDTPDARRVHRRRQRARLTAPKRRQCSLSPALIPAGEIPRRLTVPCEIHAHPRRVGAGIGTSDDRPRRTCMDARPAQSRRTQSFLAYGFALSIVMHAVMLPFVHVTPTVAEEPPPPEIFVTVRPGDAATARLDPDAACQGRRSTARAIRERIASSPNRHVPRGFAVP